MIVQRESHLYRDESDATQLLSGLNLVALAEGRAAPTLADQGKGCPRSPPVAPTRSKTGLGSGCPKECSTAAPTLTGQGSACPEERDPPAAPPHRP